MNRMYRLLSLLVLIPAIVQLSAQTATCNLPDGSSGTTGFYTLKQGEISTPFTITISEGASGSENVFTDSVTTDETTTSTHTLRIIAPKGFAFGTGATVSSILGGDLVSYTAVSHEQNGKWLVFSFNIVDNQTIEIFTLSNITLTPYDGDNSDWGNEYEIKLKLNPDTNPAIVASNGKFYTLPSFSITNSTSQPFSNYVIGWGNNSDPFNIVISENNNFDFPIVQNTITDKYYLTLTAPQGMVFVDNGTPSVEAGKNIAASNIVINSNSSNEIAKVYEFKVNGTDAVDIIYIKNLKLKAGTNTTGEVGKIKVSYRISDNSLDANLGSQGDFKLNKPTAIEFYELNNQLHCQYGGNIPMVIKFNGVSTSIVNTYTIKVEGYFPNGYSSISNLDINTSKDTCIYYFNPSLYNENLQSVKVSIKDAADLEAEVNYRYHDYVNENTVTNSENAIDVVSVQKKLQNEFLRSAFDAEFKTGQINMFTYLKTVPKPFQYFVAFDSVRKELYYYKFTSDAMTIATNYVDLKSNPYRFEIPGKSNYEYLNTQFDKVSGSFFYHIPGPEPGQSPNNIMDFNLMGNALTFSEQGETIIYKELVPVKISDNKTMQCPAVSKAVVKVSPEKINIKSTICSSVESIDVRVSKDYSDITEYSGKSLVFKELQVYVGSVKAGTDATSTYNYILKTTGTDKNPNIYTIYPYKYLPDNSTNPYIYVYFRSMGTITLAEGMITQDVILSEKAIKIVKVQSDNSGLINISGDTICPSFSEIPLVSNYTITNVHNANGVSINNNSYVKAWNFNPSKALESHIGNVWNKVDEVADSITYKGSIQYEYADNNGCPGTNTATYNIIIDNRVAGNAQLSGFNTHYCPSNNTTALLSSKYNIDTIMGKGVNYLKDNSLAYRFEYKPSKVFEDTNEVYTNKIINDTLKIRYLDSDLCPRFENIHVQVGSRYIDYSKTDTITDENGADYLVYDYGSITDKTGEIIGFKDTYCPFSDSIKLVSNFKKVNNIVGNDINTHPNSEYYFLPLKAFSLSGNSVYLPNTHTDSVTLYYQDNNGCPWRNTYHYTVNPALNNALGDIVNLDDSICPAHNPITLLHNVSLLDSITGSGVSVKNTGSNKEFIFNPDTCYQALGQPVYNGAAINSNLQLYYKDKSGCPMVRDIPFTIGSHLAVNTTGDIVNLDTAYCANITPIRLRANMNVDSIKGQAVTINTDGDIMYNPMHPFVQNGTGGYTQIHDTVTLYYRDANGCPYLATKPVTINALPEFNNLLVENLCFADTTLFTPQISVNGSNLKSLNWNFGNDYILTQNDTILITDSVTNKGPVHGGRTTGTYLNPAHQYPAYGKYNVLVTATSGSECTNTFTREVIIGAYPQLGFGVSSNKNTDIVTFTNNTKADNTNDPVSSYTWNMDDTLHATLGMYTQQGSANTLEHKFAQSGVHNIELTATTNNGCATTDTFYIPSFPVIPVSGTQYYSTAYSSGSDTTGWIPVQLYKPQQNSTWQYVPITAQYADDKHPVGKYMWITGNTAASVNERSWLESPVFYIDSLEFPVLTIDIYQSLEPGRDGAVLQYTVNNGNTWQRVGDMNSGANWYNRVDVATRPGIINETTDANKNSHAWSSDNSQWVTARYPLDSIRSAAAGSGVRFRIAYSSNDYIDTISYKGFAVSNFSLAARKRVALLEEFINPTYEQAFPNYKCKTNIGALNSFVDRFNMSVVDVRYHYSYMQYANPLYEMLSWWDISVRAAETVAKGPFWIMDHDVVSCDFYGQPNNVTYLEALEKRALVPPSLNIDNVQLTPGDNGLNISANFTKVSNYFSDKYGQHKVWVRFMLVQKQFEAPDGTVHRNVMVDMLPSGIGHIAGILPDTMQMNQTITISQTWEPRVVTPGNSYRLVIAAFTWKDGRLHEVEQVWFTDIDNSLVPQVLNNKNVKEKIPAITSPVIEHLSIYPNPADDYVTIELPENLTIDNSLKWEIISLSGVVIKNGSSETGATEIHIPLHDVCSGMYNLRVSFSAWNVFVCKVSVQH